MLIIFFETTPSNYSQALAIKSKLFPSASENIPTYLRQVLAKIPHLFPFTSIIDTAEGLEVRLIQHSVLRFKQRKPP
jgi:hypothetical protein